MIDVESDKAFHSCPGAEKGGDDHRKEVHHNILVGGDTVQHILERILLLGPSVLHIFEFSVMLMHLKDHGQHEDQENQCSTNADILQRNAYIFTYQRLHDDSKADCRNNCNDTLYSQDAVSFGRAVRQGSDHGLHGNFSQSTGEIVKQVGNHEPYDFDSIRAGLGHHEKQDGCHRESPEKQSIPGHIFAFSCDLAEYFPLGNIDFINDKAKQDIINRVNNLDDQDCCCQRGNVDPLEYEE